MRILATKRVCFTMAVSVLVSACAGITNPHISWDKQVTSATVLTLPQALAYADKAKDEYRNALGNQAQLASWLGIGLIPLMSAAAGLGVTGGPTAAIAATTMTGVAAFGVGTWLYSKPYQRAWVAGYNATSCAITAVTPLVDVSNRLTTITGHVDDLDAKQYAVVSASRDVEMAIQAGKTLSPNGQVVLRAKQRVADADALLTSAATTRTNALKLLAQVDTAGLVLKEAVDRIAGQVSAALVEAGPDLQALASIVGGLAPTYRQFVAGPESLKPKIAADKAGLEVAQAGENPGEVAAVSLAVATLDAEMRELALANRKLADDVDRLPAGNWFEAVRACGVSPEQVSAPLTLDPAGPITFTKGTAAVDGRSVKGGASPFAVIPIGSLQDLTLERPEGVFAPSFVVKISDKTPAGKITILITDKPGNRLFVPVTVNGVAHADEKQTQTAPPADAPLVVALKRLRDKIGNSLPVTISTGVTAIVTKPAVDDQAKILSVDVTLKAKNGNDLSKADSAKIPDADIQRAVAALDMAVPSANIQIRTKQGVPTVQPAAGDTSKMLQAVAEALKAPASAALAGGLTAVVDGVQLKQDGKKLQVDVSVKAGAALATPEAAAAVSDDAIKQALLTAVKAPASVTTSNIEIGTRQPPLK
jgi:hypothetical protein